MDRRRRRASRTPSGRTAVSNGKHTRRRSSKRQSSRSVKSRLSAPKTLEQFFAMTREDQGLWIDVGQIVTQVREGRSLSETARRFKRDPRTIQKLVRPALRKLRNGRWAAKPHDKLLRVLTIPTKKGLVEIGVRDSRPATVLAEYWNAVDRYRDTGDASALSEFKGRYITDANGKRVRLLTDTRELDRLASAGVLSFESLYAGAA